MSKQHWLRSILASVSQSPESRRAKRNSLKQRKRIVLGTENLEDRITPTVYATPDYVLYQAGPDLPDRQGSGPSGFFAPSDILTAYGVSSLFHSGDNGAGETIALIDAYDDPNIASDLQAFDAEFGLPNPTFLKYGQIGNGTTNADFTTNTGAPGFPVAAGPTGWDVEESLDVEWAHSMAPGATIVLVEADSASGTNLNYAADFAATSVGNNGLGAEVVSMSFGAPGGYAGETNYDADFSPVTYPHVTFLASTGDSGSNTPGTSQFSGSNAGGSAGPPYGQAGYPADSPNVVAVGGTSLTVGAGYSYSSESVWNDQGYNGNFSPNTLEAATGGGVSNFESQPSYQNGVATPISATQRVAPDVAFLADPDTGVDIYDTYSGPGDEGIGGTSLSAPSWAGLISISDQIRANNSLPSLTGATQTLPMLYALYGTPAYATDFHDITTGNNYNISNQTSATGYSAGVGYDAVTGLGTPIANNLMPYLGGGGFDYVGPTGNNIYRLVESGANYDLYDNGVLVATALVATTTSISISGAAGSDNTLEVDYSGGIFDTIPVTFDGGTASPANSISVTGNTLVSLVYNATGDEAGNFVVNGQTGDPITFTDVVSATDLTTVATPPNLTVGTLTLNVDPGNLIAGTVTAAFSTSGANTLAALNDGLPNFTFSNPTAGLAVDGHTSGANQFSVDGLGTGFNAALGLYADFGAGDSVDLATDLALGSATSTGDLNVEATSIDLEIGCSTIATNEGGANGEAFLAAVTLTNSVTITTGTGRANFDGTVDGAGVGDQSLAIVGNAFFDGAVGSNFALASLSVSGTTILGTTAVSTSNVNAGTGNQTYTGAVTLDGGNGSVAVLNATGGTVTFGSTVDAFTVGEEGLYVVGNAVFDGIVGGSVALSFVQVTGTTVLGTTAVTTTNVAQPLYGNQIYEGAVTLDAGNGTITTLTTTGGTAQFGTVDADTAGEEGLSVVGNANFYGIVGGSDALWSLSVSGTTILGTTAVKTTNAAGGSGNQLYVGAVTLEGGNGVITTLTATGGTVGFGSTVDAFAAGAEGLAVVGHAVFHGIVGGSDPLWSLKVTGTTVVGLGASAITTSNVDSGSGNQTYTGAVTLDDGHVTTMTATGGTVSFGSTLDAFTVGGQGLKVVGNAVFDGIVGGSDALWLLSVSGTTVLGTTAVSTTSTGGGNGNQTYTGAVTVDGGSATVTTLTATAATIGVTFGSTVDANAAGQEGVAVVGNAVFDGVVGGNAALSSLSVSGTSDIEASITTTTFQTYTGAVTLSGSDDLTGTTVTFVSTVDGADALTVTGNAVFDGIVGGATPPTSLLVTGTSEIEANITTTGTQTYEGAVTLSGNVDLGVFGTTATFDSTVDGAYVLYIFGNAVFDGAVGGATALSALSVTGTSDIEANITTTSFQTYEGAVTLSNSVILAGDVIGFESTVTGVGDLLTITGYAVFVGAVDVGALSVSGDSDIDTATITTTGTQTYGGAVTLSVGVTMTATTVTFDSTVNGTIVGFDALGITGNAVFNGVVGGSVALQSLSVTGTSDIEANITTTGTQTYGGAVTLSATPIDLTAAGPSTVTFDSTVDGAVAGADGLTVTGNAVFDGVVGGAAALSSLSVSGTSDIEANITTTGTQTYTGAVTLSSNDNLTGSTVTFESTLDGTSAGSQGLTVTGNAVFDGVVGGIETLASLLVTGTSEIEANITTTGTQTYEGAVTLSNSVDLKGSTITFDSTVTGPYTLIVTGNADIEASITTTGSTQTYTGAVILSNNVTLTGSTVTFDSTVNGAHSLTITGNAVFDDIVGGANALTSLSVSGTTDLNTYAVTTTGTQAYAGAVTLTNIAVTLTGTTVAFDSTVDAASTGNEGLVVTGNAAFDGIVGGTAALRFLRVTGATLVDTTAVSTTDSTGGSGDQIYQGAVTLDSTVDLTSTGGKVIFESTLDAATVGGEALTVTGNAVFDGVVGGVDKLSSLLVTGTSDIEAFINTTGTQTYTGAVTLSNPVDLTGSTVTFDSTVNGAYVLVVTGNAVFDGVVGGTAALSGLSVTGTSDIEANITTTNTQTYFGAVTLSNSVDLTGTMVTFDSTVNGAYGLTVTGNAVFDGVVGGAAALTSLSVSGTSDIEASITTAGVPGTQTYTGAVTLSSIIVDLTGTTVTFDSTVNGADFLTIIGNAVFDGAVGGTAALASLLVTGASDIEANIKTTGNQTYDGAVTLSSSINLTGSTVFFDSTVNGAYGLTITGNAVFDGVVGGTAALTSLSVSGTSEIEANITTAGVPGTQTYTGAVTLSNNVDLTGTTATFDSTVNSKPPGAYALTITGNAVFDGAVGGTTALSTLSVIDTSDIESNITTTSTQSYSGAVTLSSSVLLTGSLATFSSTVNGASAGVDGLTITGNASFDGIVGGVAALASLSVSGTTFIDTSAITTTGGQTYTGAVTLDATTTLTSSNLTAGVINANGFNLFIDDADNAVITGDISGTGSALTMEGAGTLTLTGSSTYTGGTSVTSGTLDVDNTTGSGTGTGTVNVTAGLLGGTGNIAGAVTMNGGTLMPGASPGILSMYTLDLQAAADFNIEIGGNSPGTTYDQANVTSTGAGGVTINDAVLNLTDLNGYTPQLGDQYVIIANAGTGAIAGDGTFVAGAGIDAVPANTVLTQGEIISNSFLGSGYEAVINYQGGPNGNSVVIDVLIPTYFANLNVPNSISYGTPSFTFTGTLAADSGHVPSGEDVAVTFNSITQNVPLNGNDQFQATFTTSGLQVSGSPYPVSFSYAGDLDFESSSANSTLTVYKASPYFSVSNYTIAAGTASTTVSGTLEANAYAQLVPSGETIAVTLNGVTHYPMLNGSDQFSTTFNTSSLTHAGSGYTIDYSYGGDANFNSAFDTSNLNVVPGALSYLTSTVTTSLPTVQLGGVTTVYLQTKDAYGNDLTTELALSSIKFSLNSSTGAKGTFGAISYKGNGLYSATFTGTADSTTPNEIKATISGSPVADLAPISVTGAAYSVAKSTITLSPATITVGGTTTITLQAEDATGKKETSGGLTVVFTVTNSSGHVVSTLDATDHDNGTYTAAYTGATVGSYTVRATIDGNKAAAAPTLKVGAVVAVVADATTPVSTPTATADAATSLVLASSPTVTVGGKTTVTFQAKNAAGQDLTTGGLDVVFFLVNSSGGSGTFGTVTDNHNGTYTVTFTGTVEGVNAISADVDGDPLSTPVAKITVL